MHSQHTKSFTLNIKIYRSSSTRYINSISRLFHVFYRKKRENWNKTKFFLSSIFIRCEFNLSSVSNSITVYFVRSLPFICFVSIELCQRLSFDFYSILFDFSIRCISLLGKKTLCKSEGIHCNRFYYIWMHFLHLIMEFTRILYKNNFQES